MYHYYFSRSSETVGPVKTSHSWFIRKSNVRDLDAEKNVSSKALNVYSDVNDEDIQLFCFVVWVGDLKYTTSYLYFYI